MSGTEKTARADVSEALSHEQELCEPCWDPRGAFDRILGGQRPNRHLDVKKRFGRENPTRATWP